MADPRNIAQDKKVMEEKKHHGEDAVPGAAETPQPGKKPALEPAEEKGESYRQHAQQQDEPAK